MVFVVRRKYTSEPKRCVNELAAVRFMMTARVVCWTSACQLGVRARCNGSAGGGGERKGGREGGGRGVSRVLGTFVRSSFLILCCMK